MKTKINGSSSKSDTRKLVKELRNANLFMTMSEIAQKANISKQRVFKILKQEGLPTKRKIKKSLYACPVCGTVSAFKFCSTDCKRKWRQIKIVCTRCGKLFTRDTKQFLRNYRHYGGGAFCSVSCSAKWIGEHYGFKRFPNHISTFMKAKQGVRQ